MKPTPGRWTYGKAEDGTWYIHPSDTFKPPWSPDGCISAVRPGDSAEANAHLIAAAPELLSAALEALEHLKIAGSIIGIKYTSRTALERAIARARGEP